MHSLKICFLLVSAAAAVFLHACASDAVQVPEKDSVIALTTTAIGSRKLERSFVRLDRKGDNDAEIILDPSTKFQQMDGFGMAVTGSAAYNMSRMATEARRAFIERTFSPVSGYGVNFVRIPVGCSDFSLSEYTCCDREGIENFSLTGEENKYIIPVMKEILSVNPDVRVLASPWTAPRWMKSTSAHSGRRPHRSWTGGHLDPDRYQDYAEYFVRWIRAFGKEGIKIHAVTPQNEPLNNKNSASMVMRHDEQSAFIHNALGPAFEKGNVDTEIYVFDHNYDYDKKKGQEHYPLKIYDSPASQYVAGAAYHNYSGDASEMSFIHSAAQDKKLIFTEATNGGWNHGSFFARHLVSDMENVALPAINNFASAFIVWNLMLDDAHGPNRPGGCRSGVGAVDIDRETYSKITYNSQYYAVCHLSAAVKRGAFRIKASAKTSVPPFAAFANPDGSFALVTVNPSILPESITVSCGETSFRGRLPARSVVSFIWK